MSVWRIVIVSLIVAVIMALVGIALGLAHESPGGMAYDPLCCNGDGTNGDCAPVPSIGVKATPEGWQVSLKPGDHPLVTAPHEWLIPYSETREATDGQFHACLWPDETTLRCFYAPPFAM